MKISFFFGKSPKKYFSNFFRDFFLFRKNIFWEFFLSKSIRNFPKIPKIAFRKAGNERKCSKNAKSSFLNTESENVVSFGNVLCITTLNQFPVIQGINCPLLGQLLVHFLRSKMIKCHPFPVFSGQLWMILEKSLKIRQKSGPTPGALQSVLLDPQICVFAQNVSK